MIGLSGAGQARRICVADTRASGVCHAALPQQKGEKEGLSMKSIAIATLFVLIGTSAQAEIMCSQHRGCWETGKRIFRTGGVMQNGMAITNQRDGQKDSGKPIRIRCVGQSC
jgi:hypothetical protein